MRFNDLFKADSEIDYAELLFVNLLFEVGIFPITLVGVRLLDFVHQQIFERAYKTETSKRTHY